MGGRTGGNGERQGGRGVIRDKEMSKPGLGVDIERIEKGSCNTVG